MDVQLFQRHLLIVLLFLAALSWHACQKPTDHKWECGLVIKLLIMQARGPEFRSPEPMYMLVGCDSLSVIPASVGGNRKSWIKLAGEISYISE